MDRRNEKGVSADCEKLIWEYRDILESFIDLAYQHITYPEDILCSAGLSANEKAIDVLEQLGLLTNDRRRIDFKKVEQKLSTLSRLVSKIRIKRNQQGKIIVLNEQQYESDVAAIATAVKLPYEEVRKAKEKVIQKYTGERKVVGQILKALSKPFKTLKLSELSAYPEKALAMLCFNKHIKTFYAYHSEDNEYFWFYTGYSETPNRFAKTKIKEAFKCAWGIL